jgi:septum site-determining protein MinC
MKAQKEPDRKMSHMAASNRFPIKGFREGLLIKLGEGDWDEIMASLMLQIDERQDFFEGAKISVDVDERVLRAAQLGKFRDSLSDRGINLFAVLGRSAVTQAVSESLGLFTEKTIFEQGGKREAAANLCGGDDALLIKRNLRSGMSVQHPGHIIVDGDVNPGAEILAGKSIYIWGSLRGLAYAGTGGREDEIICAMNFSLPKLRIANIILTNYSLINKLKKVPKKAYVENGEIIITDWKTKKNRKENQ